MATHLAPATSTAPTLVERMLEDQHARMIVGPGLAMRWTNAAAARLIANACGFTCHQDRLQFFHADHELRFARFLRDLNPVGAMALPLGDDGGWLLFSGRRLGEPQADLVSLIVRPDNDLSPPRYHDFESIFGLTASENRIVLALLRGSTVDAIATGSNVSITTVRTHVRKIYQKLGVGSREQLLHRLNQYRCE